MGQPVGHRVLPPDQHKTLEFCVLTVFDFPVVQLWATLTDTLSSVADPTGGDEEKT